MNLNRKSLRRLILKEIRSLTEGEDLNIGGYIPHGIRDEDLYLIKNVSANIVEDVRKGTISKSDLGKDIDMLIGTLKALLEAYQPKEQHDVIPGVVPEKFKK